MKKRKGLKLFATLMLGGMLLSSCSFADFTDGFTNFFTESIPGFFTETIPGLFTKNKKGELVKIETHDEKLIYNYGEEFVKPGVTAFYSNDRTAEVADKCTFEGFDSKKNGRQQVAVFYTEGSSTQGTTYSVTIKAKEMHFASIEVKDAKTSYEYDEEFVKPLVMVTYDTGDVIDVSSECDFTGFIPNHIGEQEITVTYEHDGKIETLSYTVTVNAPTTAVVSLEVQASSKTEYEVGDEFENPVVLASFSDGSTKDVSNQVICTGYDMTQVGEQSVTVSYTYYEGNTVSTTYSITLNVVQSKMKFAIFADVQLCNDTQVKVDGQLVANANYGTTANAPLALKSHLEFCKEQGIETILMNGDITNQANDYYYQYFNRILEEVYGTDESKYPEFVYNMGNHEWWWGVTEKETGDAVSLFENYARIDSDNLVSRSAVPYGINTEVNVPSYYKVINGIPFIVISGESSAGDVGSALRAEIEGWLAQAKTLNSVKAGGPIFVEYHCALSTSMTHGQGAGSYSSTVEEIFADTPNAVIFTGDTHYPGINERAINQVDFTTINLGSSSYSRMVNESAVICDDYYNVVGNGSKTGDILDGNSAFMMTYTPTIQIVDVKSNNSFTVDRYFSEEGGTGSHIGKQWKIDPIKSKADFKYTDARFQNVESAQDLYGANGLRWDSTDAVTFGVDPESQRATVLFKDVTNFKNVEHYLIKINNTEYDVVSNYATNPSAKGNNYYILEDVPAAESYSVTVTAYDFFDNPSLNTLSSSVNNTDLCIDELDIALMESYCDISKRNNLYDVANEDSHSSQEFYYRGIQGYQAGATCVRPIEAGKYDFSNLFTFNDLADTEPVFTFKAKATTESDLKVGISVVDSGNHWLTDFGVEYQKTVSSDGEWHEYSYNLKDLFSLTKLSQISSLQIKVKSTAALTSGYEMGILIDDIDIENASGSTPIEERGAEFTAGEDYTITFEAISDTVTIDVKFASGAGTKVTLMLGDTTETPDWDNYFGYYDLYPNTKTDDYNGLTVAETTDGYVRYTFNVSQLNKKSGSPVKVNMVYIRGSWTNASGLIDINPTQGEVVIPKRGERFESGVNYILDMPAQPISTLIVFDVLFDNADGHLNVMFGDGWSNYFGYFGLSKSSKTGDFACMTVNNLSDGYIRFTFDLTLVPSNKITGNPQKVNLFYIRDAWTNVGGYVDIYPTAAVDVIRGTAWDEVNGLSLKLDSQYDVATDSIVFDLKFDNTDSCASVSLLEEWTNYFGYYYLNSTSQTGDYAGMSVENLTDGYMRFTFKLSECNKINHGEGGNAPEYVNRVYIRNQGWSDGSGYIDLVTK